MEVERRQCRSFVAMGHGGFDVPAGRGHVCQFSQASCCCLKAVSLHKIIGDLQCPESLIILEGQSSTTWRVHWCRRAGFEDGTIGPHISREIIWFRLWLCLCSFVGLRTRKVKYDPIQRTLGSGQGGRMVRLMVPVRLCGCDTGVASVW